MTQTSTQPCIVIDPGHGATAETDDYRVGFNGEREEWVNLRVAQLLREQLADKPYQVVLTREDDVSLDKYERAQVALDHQADLFVSIHHNACFGHDTSVDYPLVFAHGRINASNANIRFADMLLQAFVKVRQKAGVVVSDVLIFNDGLGVLNILNGKVPAVFGEFSFLSYPEEAKRLQDEAYCAQEATCYVTAIDAFCAHPQDSCHAATEPFYQRGLRSNIEARQPEVFRAGENWAYFQQCGDDAFEQRDYSEAAQAYETSLSLLINHPEAESIFKQLAKCYHMLGEFSLSSAASAAAVYGLRCYKP